MYFSLPQEKKRVRRCYCNNNNNNKNNINQSETEREHSRHYVADFRRWTEKEKGVDVCRATSGYGLAAKRVVGSTEGRYDERKLEAALPWGGWVRQRRRHILGWSADRAMRQGGWVSGSDLGLRLVMTCAAKQLRDKKMEERRMVHSS